MHFDGLQPIGILWKAVDNRTKHAKECEISSILTRNQSFWKTWFKWLVYLVNRIQWRIFFLPRLDIYLHFYY